jgi:opacity protein-like surface antigen
MMSMSTLVCGAARLVASARPPVASDRPPVASAFRRKNRPGIASAALILTVLAWPSTASADVTAFLGVNPTPANRPVRGLSAGLGLVIVGFEVEYANTSEDALELAPELRTFMFNGLVQTPFPIGGIQFYGTAGGGIFRETLSGDSETNVGVNVGGGVKMTLAGPLRLRLDYRVFTLRGSPRHSKPQRFYAGLNLKF